MKKKNEENIFFYIKSNQLKLFKDISQDIDLNEKKEEYGIKFPSLYYLYDENYEKNIKKLYKDVEKGKIIEWNVLHLSTFLKNNEFVTYLIYNCDINIKEKDKYGITPLKIAQVLNYEEIINIFDNYNNNIEKNMESKEKIKIEKENNMKLKIEKEERILNDNKRKLEYQSTLKDIFFSIFDNNINEFLNLYKNIEINEEREEFGLLLKEIQYTYGVKKYIY
jgi:hypothetical protein